MPRVVIELQANTQDAVNKIGQFAKAQRDAFDAIRAANPALAEATIKVGQLTDAYAKAAKAQRDLVQGPSPAASIKTVTQALTDATGAVVAYGTASAQQKAATSQFLDDLAAGATKSSTAMGAFRTVTKDLIGDIPIVGGRLAKLSTQFGTFPLLIGGVVGAGVALLKWLDDLSTKSTKALADVTALAERMERQRKSTLLDVAGIRADAAGNVAGGLDIGAQKARNAAQQAYEDAITAATAKAESEKAGAFSVAGVMGILTSGGKAAFDEKQVAEAAEKVVNARKAAAQKLSDDLFKIDLKLKTDLRKLEDDYDTRIAEGQEKRVEEAAAAAEKQAQLLQDLADQSLTIFQGLGEPFKDVTQSLQLAQFVKDSTAAIATLQQGMNAGLDTTGRFAAGITALQNRMAEAIKLGYVPMAKAAEQVTTSSDRMAAAIKASAAAAAAAVSKFNAMADAMTSGVQASMAMAKAQDAARARGDAALAVTGRGMSDLELAKARTELAAAATGEATQARIAAQAATFQARIDQVKFNMLAPYTGIDVPGQGIYVPLRGGGVTPPSGPGESFQHGGIVPGTGPVPILAHGGERIIPAGQAEAGGARMVRIEPGAIQISGTVIDQSRDWGVLVETLGQALAARLR